MHQKEGNQVLQVSTHPLAVLAPTLCFHPSNASVGKEPSRLESSSHVELCSFHCYQDTLDYGEHESIITCDWISRLVLHIKDLQASSYSSATLVWPFVE